MLGHWNATAPLQIVVSDMTMFKVGNTYWEWTLLLDTFNNEILAHSVTSERGSNKPYYRCLDVLKSLVGKGEEQTRRKIQAEYTQRQEAEQRKANEEAYKEIRATVTLDHMDTQRIDREAADLARRDLAAGRIFASDMGKAIGMRRS